MSDLNWKCTAVDAGYIDEIVKRAWNQTRLRNLYCGDKINLEMDLKATHLNGCPLKLKDMVGCDDYNFWHDIWGIAANLNRETGQLENFFVPRFADSLGGGSDAA